jgi:Ca2+-binding EF-hand superfamily protein
MEVLNPNIRESSMDVNEFWRTKVHFYFTEILDFDSDGQVSSKDVEAFKDMYKYIKQLQQDSPELEKFSRFLNIWIENILSMTHKEHHTTDISTPTTRTTTNGSNDETTAVISPEATTTTTTVTSTPTTNTKETSISISDFMKYCENIRRELIGRTTWPASLNYMSDYIEALFNILDIDNDGFISKEDFLSNYASAEDYKSRAASWEIICNKDVEHKLDKKKFDQLCIEFLVSLNPEDPGNWIFGTFSH